ncbi:MAG: hypothetical protein ACLUSP_11220 [Christensenellales bacterium]
MSYCEVSLVFDNREKLFPSLEYDEVVVSRKLTAAAKANICLTAYRAALKTSWRFFATATWEERVIPLSDRAESTNFIRKARRPSSDFRGSGRYFQVKARKIDAERKLGRTRDNLTRIIDILDEKNKQLELLRKQAETAKKWLEMRDSLRHHEINTYIHQYDTAAEAKAVINTRLNGITEGIELKQKAYDGAVASYNESMYELNSIDKNINALREELLSLTVGMEKEAGDMNVLKERLSAHFDRIKRLRDENDSLSAESAAATANAEELKLDRAARAEELAAARSLVDEYRKNINLSSSKFQRAKQTPKPTNARFWKRWINSPTSRRICPVSSRNATRFPSR